MYSLHQFLKNWSFALRGVVSPYPLNTSRKGGVGGNYRVISPDGRASSACSITLLDIATKWLPCWACQQRTARRQQPPSAETLKPSEPRWLGNAKLSGVFILVTLWGLRSFSRQGQALRVAYGKPWPLTAPPRHFHQDERPLLPFKKRPKFDNEK